MKRGKGTATQIMIKNRCFKQFVMEWFCGGGHNQVFEQLVSSQHMHRGSSQQWVGLDGRWKRKWVLEIDMAQQTEIQMEGTVGAPFGEPRAS
uniref:Uncharacterized protein n=1 Tax=Romanomermis culicivorax TaxID=13658 RepID=A0A915JQG2_ROMCU